MPLNDQLRDEMDKALGIRTSRLDSKVRAQMDKDLGIVAPQKSALPEAEEPGYVGAALSGLKTGFTRRVPEMVGQAVQYASSPLLAEGAVSPGKRLAEWAREGEVRPEFKSPVKQALYEGMEMVGPSFALPAAATVAGTAAGLPVAGAVAAYSVPAIFGLAQAQSTKEEAEKTGVDAGNVPLITGGIEAAGETLGTMAFRRLLGPLAPLIKHAAGTGKETVKGIVKPTLGRILREAPALFGTEMGTEFGQQYGQAAVEKAYGIRPEAEPLKEAISVLAPTAVLSTFGMGGAALANKVRGRQIERTLTDKNSSPEERVQAVQEVASYLAQADKDTAKAWHDKAMLSVIKNESIPTDADIYEWLLPPKKEAAPAKTAIPAEEAPGGEPIKEPVKEGEPYDLLKEQPLPKVGAKEDEEPPAAAIPAPKPPPKAPAPSGAAAAIPPGVTAAPGGIVQPEPGQAAPQEEKGLPLGYFPAGELWDKTPGQVLGQWEDLWGYVADLEAKAKPQIEALTKELEGLKGKRDKASADRRKAIKEEVGKIEASYSTIRAEAESKYAKEYQKFIEAAEEEAQKAGVPKEKISEFSVAFQERIGLDRPAIEWNASVPHRAAFQELVNEYLDQADTGRAAEAPVEKHQAIPAQPEPPRGKEPSPGKPFGGETISGMAYRLKDGTVISGKTFGIRGRTHADIWDKMSLEQRRQVEEDDGVVTSAGRYLSRAEAGRMVSDKTPTEAERAPKSWDANELINRPVEEAPRAALQEPGIKAAGTGRPKPKAGTAKPAAIPETGISLPKKGEPSRINEAGVLVDTKKHQIPLPKGAKSDLSINLALGTDNLWRSAYWYQHRFGGFAGALSPIGMEDPGYPTREEALLAGLRELRDRQEKDAEFDKGSHPNSVKNYQAILKALDAEIASLEAKTRAIPEEKAGEKAAIPEEAPEKPSIKAAGTARTTPKEAIPAEKKPEIEGFPPESKVRDEAGNPLIMYHASKEPLTELKEGQLTKFYSRPLTAEFGENVISAYLDIRNPARSGAEWNTNRDQYDGAFFASEDYQGQPGFLAVVKSPKQIIRVGGEAAKAKEAIPAAEKVEEAAAEAATSPKSALPEPTQAQKEAGNYQKGHVSLHGLDISIENPKGSQRSGVSPEGKKWTTTLAHHYGYIRGTKGKDKDHIDVFIGPYPDSEFVAVIDQVDPKNGKFDEHKVMLGFLDIASAQVGYLANYEPGWKGLGGARGFDILEFKDWLKGDTTKPASPELQPPPVAKAAIPEEKPEEKPEPVPEKPAPEAPKAQGNRWVKLPNGKVELYFTKEEFDKLPQNIRTQIKLRFNWAPSVKAWRSKASKDMHWPNRVIQQLTEAGVFKTEKEAIAPAGTTRETPKTEAAPIDAELAGMSEEDLDEMLDEAFAPEEKPEIRPAAAPPEAETLSPYSPENIKGPTPSDMGITKKNPLMKRAKMEGGLAWTNGYFLDTGDLPYKNIEGKIDPDRPDATGLWKDVQEKATSPLGEPWAYEPQGETNKIPKVIWGTDVSDRAVGVDEKYYNYFKKKYPDAQFFSKKNDPSNSAILVKSGGNPVGIVMPVRHTIETRHIEKFRPGGPSTAAPGKAPAVSRQEPAVRPLSQILKDVAGQGVKGADEALKGLHELFGGGTLKMFAGGFDADTYAKAKPHFEAAFQSFREAGKGLKEFFETIRRQFGDAIRPYLKRFMQEKMGTAEEQPAEEQAEAPAEEAVEEEAEAVEEEADLTESTGKGERGARKKLTEQEKADREEKKKAAEEKKAKKAAMGDFQNVGYVYDPERLNAKIKDKSPKSAATIILNEMIPAKIWAVDFPEGATPGVVRMKDQVQKYFNSFKDYLVESGDRLRHIGGRNAAIEARIYTWLTSRGGSIDKLKEWAREYGETMQPIVDAFNGQANIINSIGRLQEVLLPGVGTEGMPWPDKIDRILPENRHKVWKVNYDSNFVAGHSHKYLYNFIREEWGKLIPDEADILLSQINAHKRGRNQTVVRTGLPDYREGVDLKKTEDFKEPFGFTGVGFGEEGWINQEERNRVIPAAYDSFKDLAATIGAPDKGMSIGQKLAVQFANLGHKARGAAAAYFPAVKTINFTRDNGDGTMAHEWGHGLHDLAAGAAVDEINTIIPTFYYVYDFEAGTRLADDLLAKDSMFLKRLVSSKKQQRIAAVKEEIRERFERAVRKETDYYKTAQQMDGDYTARRQEMWARAFEAYVYDNLPGRNNYLVSDFVAAGRVGGKSGVGTKLVYPAGKERETFNATIKHFLDGLEWDENGLPSLKEDYITIEKANEAMLQLQLEYLLSTVEDRYRAIWTSEPSKDGKFWYRYNETAFGPMMQPDGYVGYDKEYKGMDPTVQNGKGAVAYLTQLHPDVILDHKLENIKYEGENPTYISQEGGGIDDSLREAGEEALGEVPSGPHPRAEEGGDVRGGSSPGGAAGVGGTRVPGKRGSTAGSSEGDRAEGIHPSAPGNYRIDNPTLNDPKSTDTRFLNNLSAIRVLHLVESEGRSPTPEEKNVLAHYTGWGGMAEVFSYYPSEGWGGRAELLKGELTEEELRGAESSSVTSYYTPVPIGQFMWKLAQRLGFEKGAVLDPATGANGLFLGTLPQDLAQSTVLQGVEMDLLSARIAGKLYEQAAIENKPFQDSKKPSNRYDLTISNVPFENITPTDSKHNKGGHKLHDYYINKMIDLTAPGALCMAITTSRTLDKAGSHLQEYAAKADLVGAIRLPSGIYNATNVTTDILVFRKKIEGSKFAGIPTERWTTTEADPTTGLHINKYFILHPEMVAGKLEKVTGRYGDEGLRVAPEGDLQTTLERLAEAFPGKIVEREAVREIKTLDDLISAPGTIKEGGLYINEKGEVCLKAGGQEEKLPTATNNDRKKANIAKGFVGILDAVRSTLRAQRTETDEAVIKAEQTKLKAAYDAFVKKYGPVNDPKNSPVYNDATDSAWVLALEEHDPDTNKVTKLADIFTKNITAATARPTRAETDHDALAMSLDEFGYPNLEYMAKLRDSDVDSVLKGVSDKIVENPESGFLETVDEYLSGNVKRKLAVAREMAGSNPEYQRNVKLLEAAQPGEIPSHRITARIGASWIQPEHLTDYVAEKVQLGGGLTTVFSFSPVSNEWSMSFRGADDYRRGKENKAETRRQIYRAQNSIEARRVWGTPRMDFFELMKTALEGRRPIIRYYDFATKKTYLDEVATQAAEAKLQEIQSDFARWLFTEPSRADEAVNRFNDLLNTSVPMAADGSHLTFPGKGLAFLTPKEQEALGLAGKAKTFYPHQMNAVWKYLKNGNLYLAHEVGAGKTVTMAMIAMEAKRLRGKKKVLYVTLNDSTMGQAVAEIKMLYPLANILPVRVSTQEQRKQRSLQKIALNDFDVAIMRQQDLDRIALSPESERVFIEEDLRELREILEKAKAEGSRILEREIQSRIHALEESLKDTVHEDAKAKNLFFDDLGIDLMIVDEAHAYKNVPYATRLTRITGLNPTGSPTARAFFRKTQYLNAQYPKRDGIVLASGTALTNSIAELYNLQRMLQPQEVKKQGVWSFDRWLANYGDMGSQLEWDGARGQYKNITTNRRIVNAGRLLSTAYQNIDSVQAKDTPIRRPKIRGGEPQRVKIAPNQYVEEYKGIVLQRARNLDNDPRHAEFEGIPDNMLRIISNMSKVAIDQRLDSRYANTPMQEDSKIAVASKTILRRWQEEKEHKGVQLVFADLGVPHRFADKFKYKTEEEVQKLNEDQLAEYNEEKFEHENSSRGFNTYDGLTDELVKLGIPRQEIAFIHDADHPNKEKKAANLRKLFRRINAGEIRVLIGSTSKAGTGVNIQHRVSDVHHLDVWWNFSAWEQRNGRAIRAGNIYTDLRSGTPEEGTYIWNYVTETTVDATRWDKVFAKGKVLHSALSGDINLDVIEDISEETMSAKMMAAEASGDPLMATQATLLQQVQGLRFELSGHLDTVRRSKMDLAAIPGRIASYQKRIADVQKSRAIMEKVTAVQFVGDDRTLVLEKHGKEIAAALEAAVQKSVESEPGRIRKETLLVFGSHQEKEVKETVEGKEKKVKKYTFVPLPVQGSIAPSVSSPTSPKLLISGNVNSEERDLAELQYDKKGKELTSLIIKANVSRTVTEYRTGLDREEEFSKEQIEDLKADEPKLKKITETPWPKAAELEEKDTKLRDIERQMAERGQSVGNPETGIAISEYKAPIPAMEDISAKDRWNTRRGILYPNIRREPPPIAIRKTVDFKDFFQDRAGKFEPAPGYGSPEIAQALEGPPLYDRPKAAPVGFTTKNQETRFWVPAKTGKGYVTIDPVQWGLLQRIVGKGGSWHYESPGMGQHYLVHIDDKYVRDAAIVARQESNIPEGIQALAQEAEPAAPASAEEETPGTALRMERPARPQPKVSEAELAEIRDMALRIIPGEVGFVPAVMVDIRAPEIQKALKLHGHSNLDIQNAIEKGDIFLKVAGRMTPQPMTRGQFSALIEIGISGKSALKVKSDVLHEAFEAIRSFMLTKEERAILNRRIPGMGPISGSEKQADAFADYAMGKKGILVPRSVQTIFDKILNFIERLHNWLSGAGYKSVSDIFEEALAGKTLERYRDQEGAGYVPSWQPATRAQAYAPVYYSQMSQVLGKKLPGSGSPAQLWQTVKSWADKGEFKAEELKWSGLEEFLKGKEGRVSKQEVLDFLAANQLEIREVLKGADNKPLPEGFADTLRGGLIEQGFPDDLSTTQLISDAMLGNTEAIAAIETSGLAYEVYEPVYQVAQVGGFTKFGQWQTPGGENYRELLFALPVPDAAPYRAVERNGVWGVERPTGEFVPMISERSARQAEATAIRRNTEYERKDLFRSTHWAEPNVLAHARFNERTDAQGNRVLFIEELQSDWHQEGRKKGYKTTPPTEAEIDVKFVEPTVPPGANPDVYPGYWESFDKRTGNMITRHGGWMEREAVMKEALQYGHYASQEGVPPAPFAKTWHEFALKRMLRWAAENGFDRMAWTTGAQQAERYDLSKQVDRIIYYKVGEKYWVHVYKEGNTGLVSDIAKEGLSPQELGEFIGKEVAQKIVNGEGRKTENGLVLSNLDLKVGGEGMKGFYDRIIPDFLNKYAKKWGARVEEIKVPGKWGPSLIQIEHSGRAPYQVWDYTENEQGEMIGEFASMALAEKAREEARETRGKKFQELISSHSLPITESMKRDVLHTGQPRFKLQPEIALRLEKLKDLTTVRDAKDFWDFLRKARLNLQIKDPDLSRMEQVAGLPFWTSEQHPELKTLVQTQIGREQQRSELQHSLLDRAKDFFSLKGSDLRAVEKALTAGDEAGRVFSDNDLRDRFSLSPGGIAGYKAVRNTLDWVHKDWMRRIEDNILREHLKEKWFGLFALAHGLDRQEALDVAQALTKTRRAVAKPLKTVQDKLQKIFEEKLTQQDKYKLVKDYAEAYRDARAQIEEVKEIVREAVGPDMTQEEIDENTKALVQAYIRMKPFVDEIKELRDQLGKLRGYFPRARGLGKYRIVVTEILEDPDGNQRRSTAYYTHAVNALEAAKIQRELEAKPEYEGMEISTHLIKKEEEQTFMGASAANMQRLIDNAIDRLKGRGDVDPAEANQIRANILEVLSEDLKARGAGKFSIRRSKDVIKGYKEEDLKKVLKDYIDGWSGMVTKQDAAMQFLSDLKEISRGKPRLMAYGSKYVQDMLRNDEPMDRASARLRALAFTYFLGGSLRAAAVQMTQNYITGIPFLAREVGAKSLRAEKLYHKAMFDVAAGRNITDLEQKMLHELLVKGISEDQYIRQITREVKGGLGAWSGKVVDILAKPFSWMEMFNRKSAALAMFRVKHQQYLDAKMPAGEAYRKAFEDAERYVYKTHYLMTKANLPSLAAGGDPGAQFLKTAYTFRRFTHNYLLSLHNSFRGPDGKMALDVILRSMAYVALLGGVPALPFLDDLLDLMEKFFGIPLRSKARATLRAHGGPMMEHLGFAGIPGMIGVDVSGSLKTGIPFVGESPSDTVYGVYGGLAKKGARAWTSLERDENLRALESVSPVFMESILKAYRTATEGARTPQGKVLFDQEGKPIVATPGEAAFQTAGFRPARMAGLSGEHRSMTNVVRHYNDKRGEIYDRFALARTAEDRARVLKDAQKFNLDTQKYRGFITPISASSLRQSYLRRERPDKRQLNFGRFVEANA